MTTPTTVNVRLQLRADTAANWTAANPILLANEVGLETDTKKLKVGNGSTAWNSLAYFPSIVSGGTVLGNLEIGSTGTLTFEGSTADGFETTLAVTNPTADRTINLPNVSGTIITTGDTGTVTSTMIADGTIVNADVNASAAIAHSKLATITAGYVLIGNASNVPTATQVTGDVTISDTGVTAISSGVIVDADIAANAEIAVSKLADGAARQLLQTDAAGTGVEWTNNVDIPGTLDVTGAATFDGAVTVAGDLTVNGTTTNINTQNLVVEDKNIILGDVATPSDTTADGGGITLKGTTDKTINWIDATDAWTSSERFSVPLGSASLPSLTFTGDPNTGIYSPGADQVAISTNGTKRIEIQADGDIDIDGGGVFYDATNNRLGIGTTGPTQALHTVGNGLFTGTVNIGNETSGRKTLTLDSADNGAAVIFRADAGTRARIEVPDGETGLVFGVETAATPTERCRIDSSGRLLVGTSSDSGGALLQVNGDRIRVATAKTPASATATGTAGEICWDASYIYVCTATNTWKRAALSTW